MDSAQTAKNQVSKPGRRIALLRPIQRLEAALIDAQGRFDRALATPGDPSRIEACKQRLDSAWQAAQHRSFGVASPRDYLAWDCLAQFDREMVHLLSREEMNALWISLKAEAQQKLTDHRKQAVASLVSNVEGASGKPEASDLRPEIVAEVLKQIHITSQNQYYKIDQLRRQIAYAGLFLFVLIFGLLLVSGFGWSVQFSDTLDGALVLGTLVGLSGGVLSLAFTVVRTDVTSKIPAVRMSFEVAMMRPLIGAALALPVILVIESGFLQVNGIGKNWLIAVACFLAGFSERWFLGLMESVEGKAPNGGNEKGASGK